MPQQRHTRDRDEFGTDNVLGTATQQSVITKANARTASSVPDEIENILN
jgi:hypothetical protein